MAGVMEEWRSRRPVATCSLALFVFCFMDRRGPFTFSGIYSTLGYLTLSWVVVQQDVLGGIVSVTLYPQRASSR